MIILQMTMNYNNQGQTMIGHDHHAYLLLGFS